MTLAAAADPTPLYVVGAYLALVLAFGVYSRWRLLDSSADYFLASRSIGPFLLLMSIFGTTMTAFSLVGSTAEAYERGIGVFGLMASSSGIVHAAVFFMVGIRLWAIGKRHGFVTQIQFFRSRFESNLLGWLLFPALVGLLIPYLLIGLLGAASIMRGVTAGMFPDVFAGEIDPSTGQAVFAGAVPPWLSGLVVCGVVLCYILAGGVRAAALANACQTILFMGVGVLAFWLISRKLGGVESATANVVAHRPELLARDGFGHLQFLTYALLPLSVGMFPHLFQHWLTAKSAKTFRVTCVAHPVFIMIVWLPCVLIGIWAAGIGIVPPGGNSNGVLAQMVGSQIDSPVMTGLMAAGVLAAIMSTLDSQLVCLGTMFTHDIVVHAAGERRFDDRQKVALGRGFMLLIAAVTYVLSLFPPPHIFDLAVWCFSGFASLFPLVFAATHWRRATRAGAIASVLVAAVSWCVLFWQGMIVPAMTGSRGGGEHLVLGMMPVTLMFAASAVTLIAVSLLTSPPPDAVVDRFFEPRARSAGSRHGR